MDAHVVLLPYEVYSGTVSISSLTMQVAQRERTNIVAVDNERVNTLESREKTL